MMEHFGKALERNIHYDNLKDKLNKIEKMTKNRESNNQEIMELAKESGKDMNKIVGATGADSINMKTGNNDLFLKLIQRDVDKRKSDL